MNSKNNTYFSPSDTDSQQASSFHEDETSVEKESYFTPINDEVPLILSEVTYRLRM